MRVDSSLATEFLERAAIEQKAAELRSEGYEVLTNERVGEIVADLVAKRGNDTLIFAFKVPGTTKSPDWPKQIVKLRNHAEAEGAQFRLVLVRPPMQRHIEIDGIEAALEEALAEDPPAEIQIGATNDVSQVLDVEITSLTIHGDTAEVAGEAAMAVIIRAGDGSTIDTPIFPFTFEATLDRANRVEALREVVVDTSSWFGDEDISGPAEQT